MAERESIYIETTIPSYATARATTNIILAANQMSTRLFWEEYRQNYDLYVSDYVIDECARGDKEAAKKRLEFIAGINNIPETNEIIDLVSIYQSILSIPEKTKYDSLHLAVSVLSGIDYLLSWNFRYLGSVSNVILHEYNRKHNLWTPKLVPPNFFIKPTEEEDGKLL